MLNPRQGRGLHAVHGGNSLFIMFLEPGVGITTKKNLTQLASLKSLSLQKGGHEDILTSLGAQLLRPKGLHMQIP